MNTTRQQIIETTSELMERQGYHATGLNQIVAESAAPRGSLYYYFPEGKEELTAEAVRFKALQMSNYMRSQLEQYADPVEAIYRFLLAVAEHLEGEQCGCGAPVAAIALETAANSERLRQACEGAYQLTRAPMVEKLYAGGFPIQRAQALAVTISAALEGAVILSRAERSVRPLRLMAEEVRAWLVSAVAVLNEQLE